MIDILFEDGEALVVNKPAGLTVRREGKSDIVAEAPLPADFIALGAGDG